MGQTVAQQVLGALAARLAQISVAGGYNTDAGLHVFRGRAFLDPSTEVPALTVVENDEQGTDAEVTGTLVRETTAYQVQGLVRADRDNPLDAGHELLADIKRALFKAPEGPEFEQLIAGATLAYTGRQVLSREEGQSFAEVSVSLEVTHSERYGNPYQT